MSICLLTHHFEYNACVYKIPAYNKHLIDAGWSSLVARRAHNPKVVGSNPAPATKCQKPVYNGLFYCLLFKIDPLSPSLFS